MLLTYFLWQKSVAWLLRPSLNLISTIQKHFLATLLGADTTALYTMFAVEHLLSSEHSAFFLYGWIVLWLWEEMAVPKFLQQLQLNFIVFLLQIFETLWCFRNGHWLTWRTSSDINTRTRTSSMLWKQRYLLYTIKNSRRFDACSMNDMHIYVYIYNIYIQQKY